MKIRKNFVSNSSSTSFIVTANNKEKALGYGLTLYKVSEILEAKKKMIESANILKEINEEIMPWSIFSPIENTIEYLEDAREFRYLETLDKECYISGFIDRDRAYSMGINFPVYEEG